MRASGEQCLFQTGLFCHSAPPLTLRTLVASMPIVRAYFRETQEMLFDTHDHAFAFYGAACRRRDL
jgi:transposase